MLSRSRLRQRHHRRPASRSPAPGQAGAQTPARAKRMIVDAQVHLWTAETPGVALGGRAARRRLPEPFTIEKLVPLMDEGRPSIASWWCRRPGRAIATDYALEAAPPPSGALSRVMGLLLRTLGIKKE